MAPPGVSSCVRRPRAVVSTDFFHVDTVLVKRLSVLFFIELGRRRIWITGVTPHPHAAWVTQQARNVTSDLAVADISARFLVRDRGTKYVASFDEVFGFFGSKRGLAAWPRPCSL